MTENEIEVAIDQLFAELEIQAKRIDRLESEDE